MTREEAMHIVQLYSTVETQSLTGEELELYYEAINTLLSENA